MNKETTTVNNSKPKRYGIWQEETARHATCSLEELDRTIPTLPRFRFERFNSTGNCSDLEIID